MIEDAETHRDIAVAVDRGAGISVWRQIVLALKREMATGQFPPGARLPTELELARRFSVNRHTLRRAMSALQDEGLVRVEQGRGTFVQEQVIDYQIGRRTRFTDTITRIGRAPDGHLLKSRTGPGDATVLKQLDLSPGASVVMLDVLRRVDDRPIYFTTHYLPAERFAEIDMRYQTTKSLTAAFASYGVTDYFRKVSRITARMPTPEEAALLEQPRTLPVLITENVNVDVDGRPIEFTCARAAAARLQIVIEP